MAHIRVEFTQLQEVVDRCSKVSRKIFQAKDDFGESISILDWEVKSKRDISRKSRRLEQKLGNLANALSAFRVLAEAASSKYSYLENYQYESENNENISQSTNVTNTSNSSKSNNKKKQDDKINQDADSPESITYNKTEYLNDADEKYQNIKQEYDEYLNRVFREDSKDLNSTKNKKKDEDLIKLIQTEVIEGKEKFDDTDAKKAFLLVLKDWIEESKIKDYGYHDNRHPILEWVYSLFDPKESREITINGITYKIEYDENSLPIAQGQGVATANVSWKDRNGEHCVQMQINLLDTKVSQEALAEFGAGLAKYGEEATKKAIKEFVKETSGGLVNSDFVVELAFALTDEKKASEFCKTFADGVLENIDGKVEKSSVKFLKDFFSNIPGGEKIVGGAEKIVEFKEKYDKITAKINEYEKKYDSVKAASKAEKSLKELEVLTNEFMAFMNS